MTKKLIIPDNMIIPEPSEKNGTDTPDNVIALKPEFKDQDGDWLWQLEEGTVFLWMQKPLVDQYHRKVYDPNLGECHVMEKRLNGLNRAVKLLTNINEDHWNWVDSRTFSDSFTLHMVIGQEDV